MFGSQLGNGLHDVLCSRCRTMEACGCCSLTTWQPSIGLIGIAKVDMLARVSTSIRCKPIKHAYTMSVAGQIYISCVSHLSEHTTVLYVKCRHCWSSTCDIHTQVLDQQLKLYWHQLRVHCSCSAITYRNCLHRYCSLHTHRCIHVLLTLAEQGRCTYTGV